MYDADLEDKIMSIKFSSMWPHLKLGYSSGQKHKSNWNFHTSYYYFVIVTMFPLKKISKILFSPPLSISEVHLPPSKKINKKIK